MKDDLIRRKDVERMLDKAFSKKSPVKQALLLRLTTVPTAVDIDILNEIIKANGETK